MDFIAFIIALVLAFYLLRWLIGVFFVPTLVCAPIAIVIVLVQMLWEHQLAFWLIVVTIVGLSATVGRKWLAGRGEREQLRVKMERESYVRAKEELAALQAQQKRP